MGNLLRCLLNIFSGKSSRPWYQDLCDYYQVTPEQALELGTRAPGRRPCLPASPTTQALSGLSLEEIWALRPRETPAAIQDFYREMGAWATFRQVVYHRMRSFKDIAQGITPGTSFCEYGAGVAPVAFWLVEHLKGIPFNLTIVDVPSEHLAFGEWRLRRRIRELRACVNLEVLEVLPDQLPLKKFYQVITILEVFEHLHNPLEVAHHLYDHLCPGGLLWENYIRIDNPSGEDLPVAQEQREQVFDFIKGHFQLISGRDPAKKDGGGTRCWKKL